MPSLIDDEDARAVCARLMEQVATRIYKGPDYRVSLLSTRSSPDRIEPVFRYELGQLRVLEGVHMRFRKGVPVAGIAWEQPRRAFIFDLPAFATPEDVVRFYRDDVKLTDEELQALNPAALQKYRSILCIGLHQTPQETPLVLSVDSLKPDVFILEVGGEAFVRCGGKLIAALTTLAPELRQALKGGRQ